MILFCIPCSTSVTATAPTGSLTRKPEPGRGINDPPSGNNDLLNTKETFKVKKISELQTINYKP
jgi:hypothetical protein